MMHETYRELLQRALDEDLSPDEQSQLDAHLASCGDCRREWEECSQLMAGLSKLSRVMPERSFVDEMSLEIARAVQAEQRTKKRLSMPRWLPGASAAAVAVLAVGLSFSAWEKQPDGPAPKVADATVSVKPEPAPVPVQEQTVQNPQPTLPTEEPAPVHAEPERTLITQQTVKEKPSVQVVAAAADDLKTVETQVGVTVQPIDLVQAGGSQPAETADVSAETPILGEKQREPESEPLEERKPRPSEETTTIVVATVDGEAGEVTVSGNEMTVTVVPDENEGEDGSDVRVYELTTEEETNTVIFTDPHGNIIDSTRIRKHREQTGPVRQ